MVLLPGASDSAHAAGYQAPVLNSFSLDQTSLSPGDHLKYTYDVTNPNTGGMSVTFYLTDPYGHTELISSNYPSPTTGTIDFVVPQSWRNGTYTLGSIL